MMPRRAVCPCLLLVFLWVFCAHALHGDGGRVLAEKQAGAYRVVLFGSPSPLRAGLADLSLFIAGVERGEAVLDAVVSLRLNKLSRPTPEQAWKGSGCITPGQAVPAVQGHSGNGLLYSAMVGIPEPGLWDFGVAISRHGEKILLSFELPVERPLPPVIFWWPLVSLTPLGILLYVWRGYLLKKRRTL